MALFFYFLLILFELIFVFFFTLFSLSLLWSSLKGSPYVPTDKKELDEIFPSRLLKKKDHFLELGCGDGRVVFYTAKKYHCWSRGVDINPLLIFYDRLIAKFLKVRKVKFRIKNIFDVDISQANVIYLFLMPKLLKKLAIKLKKETREGCLIISHGFAIQGMEKKLARKLVHKPFPTYYYQL